MNFINNLVITEGEEVYLKYVSIPKIKKRYRLDVIKNELKVFFKENEEIVYSVVLCSEFKDKYEYAVYYSSNKDVYKNNKIIYIQFSVVSYYYNKIKDEKYILIFKFSNIYYLLLCKKNLILFNQVIKENDYKGSDICNLIDSFILSNKNITSNVYILNCNDLIINNKELNIFNLGLLKKNILKNKKIYFKSLYNTKETILKKVINKTSYYFIILLLIFNTVFIISNIYKYNKLKDSENYIKYYNSKKSDIKLNDKRLVLNNYEEIQTLFNNDIQIKINSYQISENECILDIDNLSYNQYIEVINILKLNKYVINDLSVDEKSSNPKSYSIKISILMEGK